MCLITKKWRSLPITDQTGGCRFARSIFSPTFCSNCGRLCFCCSASFECKGLFQLHDRCCPFSDLAADLPMRVLPEAPAMIAGFSTDHLPVFERSVNAAIRCASNTSSLQGVFGTRAAVPTILITIVQYVTLQKGCKNDLHQN